MIPKSLLKRIDEKHALLQGKRPMSPSLIAKLKEQFALELTYHSNAIEGNQLTLKETYLVINDGLTVKGKSLKDHLEAKSHYEATQFLYELIDHEKRHSVSEALIRSLQKLVVNRLDDEQAGNYRTGSVLISGSKHKPPDAYDVLPLMHKFVSWLRRNTGKMHAVELAALAHHKIVHIHPFSDGNGRTARLFMNVILMQQGYPLVVILKNERKQYYRSLEKADRGDRTPFVTLVAHSVERSMSLYLKAMGDGNTPSEKWMLLSTLSTKTRFSEKYLNLLARAGKLEAHKEGRNWMSSVNSLQKYLLGRERKRSAGKPRRRKTQDK